MECIKEIPVYDKGTSIQFTIRDCGGVLDAEGLPPILDITDANSIIVVFRKSDDAETIMEREGTIFTGGPNGNGTDGIVHYITLANEIDVIGTWKAQAIVIFPTTPVGEYSSTEIDISVVATLRHPE